MNLMDWLDGLGAAFGHTMNPIESFEYLQELKDWDLTDAEWDELKSLAKRRSDFFPRISELGEIMHEVKRQTEAAKKNGTPVWETFQGADGRVYVRRPIKKAG